MLHAQTHKSIHIYSNSVSQINLDSCFFGLWKETKAFRGQPYDDQTQDILALR